MFRKRNQESNKEVNKNVKKRNVIIKDFSKKTKDKKESDNKDRSIYRYVGFSIERKNDRRSRGGGLSRDVV